MSLCVHLVSLLFCPRSLSSLCGLCLFPVYFDSLCFCALCSALLPLSHYVYFVPAVLPVIRPLVILCISVFSLSQFLVMSSLVPPYVCAHPLSLVM